MFNVRPKSTNPIYSCDTNTLLSTVMKVLLVIVFMAITGAVNSSLHPLVLVPGAGGNQIEARLTKAYKPTSLICSRFYPVLKDKDGWFRLWFDPTVLLSPFTTCFAERMSLFYNHEMDDYENALGVQTRVPQFGSTQSLRYLDPHLKTATTYMEPLVKTMEKLGYVDGETLFGAPYDFRYGLAAKGHPSKVGSKFLQDLKELIEKAYDSNGGKQVIILSHSLGGLFVLNFLNRNPLSWRQKYIKHFIALSTPWGGTVLEMLTFASGYSLGVPLVEPLLVRQEQRSSESNLWLMPSPKIFGGKNPLVITSNSSYTSYDIARFLNDIGFPEGVVPYETRVLPLDDEVAAPQVAVTCIIGSGVDTPETLLYGILGFDKQPVIVYGDGDGSVNMESLTRVQLDWAQDKNQTVKIVKVPGVSHEAVLKDDDALQQIVAEISSINSNILERQVSQDITAI